MGLFSGKKAAGGKRIGLAAFAAAALTLLFLAASCTQPFSLKELVDGPDGKALTISPSSTVLQINDSLPIETSGGIPPYSYSVVAGTGVFVGNVYTAPPSPGTERLRVTDKAGTAREAVITVENTSGAALGITPGSGTVYTGGTIDFTAVGGTGPFAFSVAGASGGSINASTGLYTAGHYAGTDTVTVTDTSDSSTATAAVTVQAKPLAISPASMTVYTGQTIQFAAVGGDGGFGYSIGTNASGAALAGNVYTAGQTPGTDTVILTDSYDMRTRTATVTVQAMSLVTNVDYAAGAVGGIVSADVLAGSAFDAQFQITNAGSAAGTQPISWTVYASTDTAIGGADDRIAASGSLGGLASGATATVDLSDGTGGVWPSEAGSYYLLVEVYAADDLTPGNNRNRSAGTTGIYEPVRMTPAAASASTGGDITFTVTGGTGSYTYAVTTAGSGAPVFAGGVYTAGALAGTDILQVSDAAYSGAGWTASVTVTVAAKTLSISPGTITVFVNQAVTFSAIGGTGPIFGYAVSGTSGGTINAATGAYTAGPNPGTDTVVLTDTYDGRTRTATVTVVDTATNVDYAAGAITNIVSADILAGSGFNADFSIFNGGSANGSRTISWTVYASLDTAIGGADDRVAASGSLAGTAAGSTTPVSFGGVWPTEAGNYYLLVEVSAADDLAPGNNRNRSAGQTQIYAPLSISPASASVYTGQQVAFTVTGGTGIYAYAVTAAGSGAPSFAGGLYTAGASSGTDSLTVSDSSHPAWTATASVTVTEAPAGPPPPVGDVDYYVSVPPAGGAAALNSPVSASFTAANQGTEAGAATVYWNAYISADTFYDAGDTQIDSGSFGGLASGASVPQTVDGGTWTAAGTWYILVHVTAADEPDVKKANNICAGAAYTVTDPSPSTPDYKPEGITMYFPFASAGGAVDEFFTLTNIGTAGAQNVSWTAYASIDAVPNAGEEIGSGVTGPLGAGGSLPNIPLLGAHWPSVPGNYYLIVRTSAADESVPGDYAVSTGKFTVSPPPDYTIESVTFPAEAKAGTPVSGGFTIRNVASAGGDGKKKVGWEVFLSFDAGFSADDLLLGSGEIAPLAAGASTVIGPSLLSTTTWPGYGLCRILLRIAADDDASAANNTYVSPLKELYFEDSEGPDYLVPYNNGEGTTNTRPIAGTQVIGDLYPGQTIVIRGWIDDSNTGKYDTFRFTPVSGVGTVRTYAAWSTGGDMGGLYLWWDRDDLDTYSTTTAINREPGSGYLSTSGWTSTDVGYVSLRSYLYVPAGTYYPYTIYLQGTD